MSHHEHEHASPAILVGCFALLASSLRQTHGLTGHLRHAVLVALPLVLASLMFAVPAAWATGDANQASCSAKENLHGFPTEQSPGFRAYLPDCRAYELVTPPYKEGEPVLDELGAVSTDGSRVIVGAGGAFAGAENLWLAPVRNPDTALYEFVRGADGWQSTALTPPASSFSHSALMAASAGNFEATLWGAQHTGLPYHEDIYLRTGQAASEFSLVGPGTPLNEKGEEVLADTKLEPTEVLHLVGASRDLSRSLFAITRSSKPGPSNLWVGDTTGLYRESLYEYTYTGAASSEPVLVGVKNDEVLHGSPHVDEHAELISNCGTELGSGGSGENAEVGKKGSVYNAVSSNGDVIYFTALACPEPAAPKVDEVSARIGGEHTVALSEPVLPGGGEGECTSSEPCHGAKAAPATFEGASEDGRRVFFLSEQPLVDGAPAAGMKLYEEHLEGASASQVGVTQVVDVSNQGIAAGVDPEVQGVVRVSEDGERVYFVAKGTLTGSDRVAGRKPEEVGPAPGADNLYVYEPEPGHPGSYRTVFVATLLTPSEEATLASEEVEEEEEVRAQAKKTYAYELERAETELLPLFRNEEYELYFERLSEAEEATEEKKRAFIHSTVGTRGPSGTLPQDQLVWQTADSRPAQTTPGGDILVFPSSAKLTLGDMSSVPQLFTYNADEESLTRVSIGQTGPASGNVDTFRDAPQIPTQRFGLVAPPTAADTGLSLAAGGSRVFFTSAAELAPGAEHNAVNVYEYSDGVVYLISSGNDASLNNGSPSVSLLGADSSGQNAFFTSEAGLVPQYGDTQVALYDAREEGGFPAAVLEPGCLGETCRGSSGSVPPSQSPGTVSQTGAGNLPPAAPTSSSKPRPKPLSRAEKLAKALRTCRKKRSKKLRTSCKKQALRAYGPAKKAKRATTHRRSK